MKFFKKSPLKETSIAIENTLNSVRQIADPDERLQKLAALDEEIKAIPALADTEVRMREKNGRRDWTDFMHPETKYVYIDRGAVEMKHLSRPKKFLSYLGGNFGINALVGIVAATVSPWLIIPAVIAATLLEKKAVEALTASGAMSDVKVSRKDKKYAYALAVTRYEVENQMAVIRVFKDLDGFKAEHPEIFSAKGGVKDAFNPASSDAPVADNTRPTNTPKHKPDSPKL